jgi:hypothetical protein
MNSDMSRVCTLSAWKDGWTLINPSIHTYKVQYASIETQQNKLDSIKCIFLSEFKCTCTFYRAVSLLQLKYLLIIVNRMALIWELKIPGCKRPDEGVLFT